MSFFFFNDKSKFAFCNIKINVKMMGRKILGRSCNNASSLKLMKLNALLDIVSFGFSDGSPKLTCIIRNAGLNNSKGVYMDYFIQVYVFY